MSCILQCCDQWAADIAIRGAAAFYEIRQHALDARQVGKPCSHVCQLVLGLLARLGAMRSIFKLQQIPDLVQAESQALGRFDKAHSRQIRLTVVTNAAQGPVGLLHQAFALIEADRLDVDPGGIGQDADGQCFKWFAHGA